MISKDKNLFLQQSCNIVAVTSGIGSMGKTWLATTLAHALYQLKKKILLFDADNGLANIGFQIGLKPTYYLNDVANDTICFNQAIFPIYKKKFDVLSGITGSELLENMPLGRLQLINDDLTIISKNYDMVIMDLSASEKIINNLIPLQSDVILVCTNEPSNLVSTYKFLQDMSQNRKYKSMRIVINYANSYEEGRQTYNMLKLACEQFLKETPEFLGIVRRDTRVRDAIRNQTLLLNRYPDSEAVYDVLSIARKILEKEAKNDE